jgi:predicted RND superfamily exporter protein
VLARWASFVVRRPGLVLAAALAATLALAAQTPRLVIGFDPESAFPSDHPAVLLDREIRAEFGGRNLVVVAVVARAGDVWRPDVLAAVHGLTETLRALPGSMEPSLVSLASPNVRRVEVTDDGVREEYVMRDVPATADAIAALRAHVMGNPLLRGGVVSDDERAALVSVDFWPGTPAGVIATGIADALARHAGPAYTLHATGEPIFTAAGDAYAGHVPWYLGSAIGIMTVVLLASFRTWQGMLLPIATGVLSTVWGLGLMAATGVPLGLVNQSVPTLVVIIAAGHSAQMLKRYYEEWAATGDNRRAVFESLVRLGPVMVAAGTTAALGFASMAFLGLPGMADFGRSAAYGIASALVLELSFMPALRVLLAPRSVAARVPVAAAWRRLGAGLASRRGRAAVLSCAAVTLGLGLVGAAHLRPAGPNREYLPAGHAATRDLEVIRAHVGTATSMTVLYDGPPGSATSLPTLAALDRFAAALRADPDVTRVDGLPDLVKEVHAAFAPDRAWALPGDSALLAQLLFLGRGAAFERFVDRADARTVVRVGLRTDEPAAVRRVLDAADAAAGGIALAPGGRLRLAGGSGPMEVALESQVTRGKVLNVLALVAAVYLVSSIVLRSPAAGAFVVVPLVLALAVTVGLMACGGVRFDLVSSSVVAVAVGIGADYAIYVLHRLREEHQRGLSLDSALARALETAGRAVMFVAVAIALGFGVFAVSSYEAFRLAGVLTPAAMLAAALAAVSVMPAAVLAVRPAFLARRGRALVSRAP